MKIWIDLTNSPHINFFKPFKKVWEQQGHDVIITTRDLSNTIELVEQNKWEHTLVSGHAGKNRALKVMYFVVRVFRLWLFLRNQNVDVGVSHSSFCAPLVGKLIGCRTVYLNDNEHAKGNYLAFPFATVNLLPEALANKYSNVWFSFLLNFKFYSGIKEGVYLSQRDFLVKKNVQGLAKPRIYVRLEPDSADYYSGDTEFLDELLIQLSAVSDVVILPRNERQKLRFQDSKFSRIEVSDRPLSLDYVAEKCDVFMGAGGSMSRELAFLNVTTLSIYQGDLLEVDKYLVSNKFMQHNIKPTFGDVVSLIAHRPDGTNEDLFRKGVLAFKLVMDTVHELGSAECVCDD